MATRKTRGPRTPHERARDAARSAATLLERTEDDELHAVATMLRFEYEGHWDKSGWIEAAATARLLLLDEWRIAEELHVHDLNTRRIENAERRLEEVLQGIADLQRQLGLGPIAPPAVSLVPDGGDDA